ncbi:MAG: hypothetical protein CMJ89_15775 [Planctomycetes bacterium]|nr:hypothetical protein [Planctomycetota bacterium]
MATDRILSIFMRRLYGLFFCLWAPLFACCLSAPEPGDWLGVGFRTPEQTFRTFQTGLRADQPDLEYRCFALEFKRQNIENQGFYRQFREELFRRNPLLKLAATAEIIEVQERPRGVRRLIARVDTWFHDEVFAVDFVREDYYEIFEGEEIGSDDFCSFEDSVALKNDRYIIVIPANAEIPLVGISEIRIGSSWRIASFPTLETP